MFRFVKSLVLHGKRGNEKQNTLHLSARHLDCFHLFPVYKWYFFGLTHFQREGAPTFQYMYIHMFQHFSKQGSYPTSMDEFFRSQFAGFDSTVFCEVKNVARMVSWVNRWVSGGVRGDLGF